MALLRSAVRDRYAPIMRYLFLLIVLWFAPSFASYLDDLEELGYCVIPRLFSESETECLYERVWHEFIEKAWPQCRLDDRSNWKDTFPMHNPVGIFAGPAGQIQVMWDLRQDPRIVSIFADIWNTHDLIVSMDGLGFMCPTEIREFSFPPWPHVDQTILKRLDGAAFSNKPPDDFVSESSLKTKPYTIQGQFLFEDSFEGDGGFCCIPKSHLRFSAFAPHIEVLDHGSSQYLLTFFSKNTDEQGNAYHFKHITAPRGSLILWDSRTVHWNQYPKKERAQPKVRMVGYLSYVPKARLAEEGKALRKEAFERGISTGHNAVVPELKETKDHIDPQFIRYLEDPGYTQPRIRLTPLGESLLGIK